MMVGMMDWTEVMLADCLVAYLVGPKDMDFHL
jgi:hypothetical protein